MTPIFRALSFGAVLRAALCFAAASAATVPALANDDGGRFGLTLFGGRGFDGSFETASGENIELADDATYGFIFNLREDASTQWEAFYLRQDTRADTTELEGFAQSVATEIHYLQGGGTYEGTGERVRGFASGGIGLTHIRPLGTSTKNDTFVSLSVGGGAQFRPAARVGVRLEARLFGTVVNSNSKIYCGTTTATDGGCLFTLNGDMLWQTHLFAGVTFRF